MEDLSYEPTGCDGWTNAGRVLGNGDVDAAVVLPDDRIFVVGAHPRSPQLLDPTGRTAHALAPAPWDYLAGASAALLSPDRILVVGTEFVGEHVRGQPWRTAPRCFVFDLGNHEWQAEACPDTWQEGTELRPVVTALGDGRVFAFDGVGGGAVYDEREGGWTGETASNPAASHGQIALPDDRVLVVGGGVAPGTWVYGVQQATFAPAAPAPLPFARPDLVTLPDGRVLVLPQEAEPVLYDPETDAWTTGPPLIAKRRGAGAAVTPEGSVLVVGGWDANLRRVPFAELLQPGADAWVYAGSSCEPRERPVVVSTRRGTLVLGGLAADGIRKPRGLSFALKHTNRIERWHGTTTKLRGLPPKTLAPLTDDTPDLGERGDLRVGEILPDVTVEHEGRQVRLSHWRGVRVVDVWNSPWSGRRLGSRLWAWRSTEIAPTWRPTCGPTAPWS